MKVVILAGGFGTRISEESHLKPKPMIEIGEMPIIWHIMKTYSHYGYNNFIIAAGYKQEVIKQWFVDYIYTRNDITLDIDTDGKAMITIHNKSHEPWKVTIVDTGLRTQTGGRIKRLQDYIGDEDFMVAYGDGLANIDINAAATQFYTHVSSAIGLISTYNYQQNKGVVNVNEDTKKILSFREKSEIDSQLINIGFMIFKPKVFEYLTDDQTILEKDCLPQLAAAGLLDAYHHDGFWQCMDTIREKELLEKLWSNGNAPWKVWEDENEIHTGKYTVV